MKLILHPGVAVSGTLCLSCNTEHEPPFCEGAAAAAAERERDLFRNRCARLEKSMSLALLHLQSGSPGLAEIELREWESDPHERWES